MVQHNLYVRFLQQRLSPLQCFQAVLVVGVRRCGQQGGEQWAAGHQGCECCSGCGVRDWRCLWVWHCRRSAGQLRARRCCECAYCGTGANCSGHRRPPQAH